MKMNFIINTAIMIGLFLIGIILFTIKSFNHEFVFGLALLLTSFVIVNCYGLFTKSLPTKMLSYMVGVALLFVSTSVLITYGFEQKAIGHETLYDFSLVGVAASMLLFFLASFFFLIGMNSSLVILNQPQPTIIEAATPKIAAKQSKTPALSNILDSEDWEEASSEDIESGEYIID